MLYCVLFACVCLCYCSERLRLTCYYCNFAPLVANVFLSRLLFGIWFHVCSENQARWIGTIAKETSCDLCLGGRLEGTASSSLSFVLVCCWLLFIAAVYVVCILCLFNFHCVSWFIASLFSVKSDFLLLFFRSKQKICEKIDLPEGVAVPDRPDDPTLVH